jgi:hypothetical protein
LLGRKCATAAAGAKVRDEVLHSALLAETERVDGSHPEAGGGAADEICHASSRLVLEIRRPERNHLGEREEDRRAQRFLRVIAHDHALRRTAGRPS